MKYLLILLLISPSVFAEYASEANQYKTQQEYYQLQQQQLEQDRIQNELYLQQQFHRDMMNRVYDYDKRTN
jgi:hypothetical protein